MYIKCYKADEYNFDHHGEFKVFVDDESSNIYRALNGQYYCEFKVLLTDRFAYNLLPRMIVKLYTPNKKSPEQHFRIVDLNDDGQYINFTGYHIAWDLSSGFLPHVNIVGKTRKEACEYILEKANEVKSHRFTIEEVEAAPDQKTLQIVRYNPLVALMGSQDNTILHRYGNTEFDFDNFNIEVYNRLGTQTDFLIKDDKNIESYGRELDYKPIATRIIPQGADELLLPEYYVDSPNIGLYDEIFYRHVLFQDIGVDEEEGINNVKAIELLREAANKLFSDSKIDMPALSWTITFDDGQDHSKIPLQLKQLMKLDIGDGVLVSKTGLGKKIESRIVEYNYNFAKRKYVDITLSSVAQSFTVSIDKSVANLSFKVDHFNSVVSTVTEDLYSKIEQTEKKILLEVAENVDTLNDMIVDLESSVEIKAGEVAIQVSKTEINNLQISGANLLINSDVGKQLDRADGVQYNQISYEIISSHNNRILSQDTTFSLSFIVGRNGNFDFECFDTITFDNGWVYRWTKSDIDKITLIQGSTYKFVMKPKILPKGATIADRLTFIAEGYYGGGWFYNIMLTEGEKAFDWQPATIDITSSIAKIDVKADNINLSVNNVKDNLTKNYSTTEQMNTSIELSEKEIKNIVEETYVTKNTAEEFATKSELSQTNENLTAKFNESGGGGNLVANGDFTNGRDNWWVWGDTHYYLDSIPNCRDGARLGSNSYGGFVSNQFRFKPNTKYTLSFDGYVEVNVIGAYATIEMFDGNGTNRGLAVNHGIQRSNQKHIIHFTTQSDIGDDWVAHIMFKHEGSHAINSGYLMVLFNVCLTEGYNSGEYVPSTKTLYEGITRIDKTGVKVTHSIDNSYSHMGPNGFKYYDSYANWTYHSLMKQGWLGQIHGTNWSREIRLPDSFKGKTFSVIISVTEVGATNTHDVIKAFKVTVPHDTVNYANGTFVINGSAVPYYVPGQAISSAVYMDVSWIAIC